MKKLLKWWPRIRYLHEYRQVNWLIILLIIETTVKKHRDFFSDLKVVNFYLLQNIDQMIFVIEKLYYLIRIRESYYATIFVF